MYTKKVVDAVIILPHNTDPEVTTSLCAKLHSDIQRKLIRGFSSELSKSSGYFQRIIFGQNFLFVLVS